MKKRIVSHTNCFNNSIVMATSFHFTAEDDNPMSRLKFACAIDML